MDFDFNKFSTRSFERFAQAMALHVLGNGVLVFGDGPDGAREATYEGQLNYPSPDDKWSGYTVMQAKFLQVPGSPREDADWLVGQLRTELNKFIAPDSELKKPDYYILVSNARLSPMPAGERGKGGIAKIDEVFTEYKSKLGLKDYRVWHLDQLSTILMNADQLRRSYAAWLSSSDVIADILSDMHSKSKSVQDSMYRYLTRELRSHQPIRLQQAGHSGNSQTMIEDVFTDLPFHIPQQRGDKEKSNKLLLTSLLERSRDCLDGASVTAQQDREEGRPERILLLGGPGQGKSTVSQFLAQIFRASILRSTREGKYPAEIDRIIDSTLKKASASEINIEIPRRFPLRVDLPNFADWLSKSSDVALVSLLHYIAQHITTIATGEVNSNDLRHWISTYPTILILDGLDEVPSSANRSAVIRAINEFWDEATNADLLMIVTTRPQGYNDDLDPAYYSKLEMIPLAPQQALAYANKLATALITDPLQAERVIARLSEAAESKTTARLLVSPLQVAILLALIDQRGDAPTDRWNLFDKYFAVMLQREQGKAGPVGQTMRHWSRQISAIHYKAGFLLHVEAEIKGNSETYLSSSELEALIRGQLEDEHYEGDELQKSTSALLEVSTERLVLLVQRAEDRFSFEVRSLQEFMAAAYLMTGREAVVQKRLCTIANREHWLHVFQIAASKCFSINDAEHYRDTIITLCSDINESGEEMDRLLRTGSRLALALLDDGLAYDQPKYRRLLFNTALDLLSAGSPLLPKSLADHCDREPTRTIEHLKRYLRSTQIETITAAWKLIFNCTAKGHSWPDSLLEEFWPQDPEVLGRLFATGITIPVSSQLHSRMQLALSQTSICSIRNALDQTHEHDIDIRVKAMYKSYPCLRLLRNSHPTPMSMKLKIDGNETPISFKSISITLDAQAREIYHDIPNSEAWAPQLALKDFHEKPSAHSLADLIYKIEENGWHQHFVDMLPMLPWPCATLFSVANSNDNLVEISKEIRAGLYGDHDDWRAAEERWNAKGIDEHDLSELSNGVFFDRSIATIGTPLPGMSYTHMAESSQLPLVNKLIPYALRGNGVPRSIFRQLIEFILTLQEPSELVDLDTALFLLEENRESPEKPWINPKILENMPASILSNETLLQRIDRNGQSGEIYLLQNVSKDLKSTEVLPAKVDNHPGLIVFLANLIAGHRLSTTFDIFKHINLSALEKNRNSVVSRYAKVLILIFEKIDDDLISSIIQKKGSDDPCLPDYLLKQFLDDDRLDRERGRSIAEAIAGVVNRDPALHRSIFMPQIQAFAHGRLADLHQSHCWLALEFGETLLALSTKRRKDARL